MAITVESVERKSSGSMPYALSDQTISGLSTHRDREDEIWSQLELYYAVNDSRDDFLKRRGINDPKIRKQVGKSFTAYLTQGRNFFGYAKSSDYRSAPLLYYYSFMNLAKAK